MLTPDYSKKFEKDVKRAKKRGKDLGKLKKIIIQLINEEVLSEPLKDQ